MEQKVTIEKKKIINKKEKAKNKCWRFVLYLTLLNAINLLVFTVALIEGLEILFLLCSIIYLFSIMGISIFSYGAGIYDKE